MLDKCTTNVEETGDKRNVAPRNNAKNTIYEICKNRNKRLLIHKMSKLHLKFLRQIISKKDLENLIATEHAECKKGNSEHPA